MFQKRDAGSMTSLIKKHLVIPALYVAVFIYLWNFYVRVNEVPQFLLPAPDSVLSALAQLKDSGELFGNLSYTVSHIFMGFIGGILIGVPLGYLIWKSEIISQIFRPYIVLVQAAPKIAIAPLLVLWFGLGATSQLILIFALTFFPMMTAMILGLSTVPRDLDEMGKLLAMGNWRFYVQMQLPFSLPALFSGAKIAIVDSMTGAFLAEYIAGNRGLGYLMNYGSSTFNSSILFASVICTVLVGLIGFGVVALTERALVPWNRQ
jgi:NitT/TauT family transport system permease protein